MSMNDIPKSYCIRRTSKSGKTYLRVRIGNTSTNSKHSEKYVDCKLVEDEKSKYAKLYMSLNKDESNNKMLKLIARRCLQEIGYKIKATHYGKASHKSLERARKKRLSFIWITT